jgi:phosphopantetheinyl transferase
MTTRPVVTLHVARVGEGRWDLTALLDELDPAGRARAQRARHPLDVERTAVGRALLRQAGIEAPVRHASVSHAGSLVVVAVAPAGNAVGVDVEPVDPRRTDLAVARRFFAPRDVDALETLDVVDQPRAFARVWTRLEAEAKGRRVTLDALRGRTRTGHLHEIDVDPDHVMSLWTAVPVALIRADPRLLASVA